VEWEIPGCVPLKVHLPRQLPGWAKATCALEGNSPCTTKQEVKREATAALAILHLETRNQISACGMPTNITRLQHTV
jgi:hypothetical protein